MHFQGLVHWEVNWHVVILLHAALPNWVLLKEGMQLTKQALRHLDETFTTKIVQLCMDPESMFIPAIQSFTIICVRVDELRNQFVSALPFWFK